MEGCKPHHLNLGRSPKKMCPVVALAVAIGVAIGMVALGVPALLQSGRDSGPGQNSSVGLEKTLILTNRSLHEALEQRDNCREKLGQLEGKMSLLEQALANVTRLQERTQELQAVVSQQQEQLQDLESSREQLQLQNRLLQEQIQDFQSQHSGGNTLRDVFLSLLALLLGMLLL